MHAPSFHEEQIFPKLWPVILGELDAALTAGCCRGPVHIVGPRGRTPGTMDKSLQAPPIVGLEWLSPGAQGGSYSMAGWG